MPKLVFIKFLDFLLRNYNYFPALLERIYVVFCHCCFSRLWKFVACGFGF